MRVVIPYRPREAFAAYHASTKRFAVTVAHRRAGKTVARINKLIRKGVECTLPQPRYGYIAPYFVQAKDIAWQYLKHYSAPLMLAAGGGKRNEAELSITLPHNGAVVRLYGADNIDRMRGLYFDGLCVDEAQDIAPSALTSVLLPALADRKGWLDLSGTPKGWGNLLGKSYKAAQADPEWSVQLLRASETGILDDGELALMRRNMPANEYDAEFECSFDAAVTGAYYAPALTQAQTDGRIAGVPYDRAAKVHTWWDLGVADSTVIWFVQLVGREIRVIDYYEANGKGLDHYAKVLQDRGYLYGQHIAPHDIAVREFGSGRSRIETAQALGIKFDTAPNLPVKDGIDATRMVLGRCWFDAQRCATGLDALRQYREHYDDKRGVSRGPLHNFASHAADAFRYGVVALEERVIVQRAKEREAIGHYGGEGWMA
jgi:hypothetical protein